MGKTFNCGKISLGGEAFCSTAPLCLGFYSPLLTYSASSWKTTRNSPVYLDNENSKYHGKWLSAPPNHRERMGGILKSQPTNSTRLRGYSYPYFCIWRARGILVVRHMETNQIMSISAKHCTKPTIKHLKSCLCSDKKEQV